MPLNWAQATAAKVKAITEALECPKCQAANQPGATIIEFDPRSWTAVCGVCSHDWRVLEAT